MIQPMRGKPGYIWWQENLWPGLFLLVAGGTVLANTLFLFLGTAELQAWNWLGTEQTLLVGPSSRGGG